MIEKDIYGTKYACEYCGELFTSYRGKDARRRCRNHESICGHGPEQQRPLEDRVSELEQQVNDLQNRLKKLSSNISADR